MKKNVPGAINKLQWRREIRAQKDKIAFEIIIKENGKTIYFNKAYAGVVNFVQSVDKFDVKKGVMVGDCQAFGFGHPCVQLFAFDQLRQKLMPVFKHAAQIYKELTGHPGLKKWMEAVGKANTIKE